MPRRPSTRRGIPWRGPLVVGMGLLLLGIALYLVGFGPHEVGQVVEQLVEWADFGSPEIEADHERVQIAASADAEWSEGGAPDANGRVPLGGTLALRQGLAEVVFPLGTRLILQGPAELQLVSAQSAHLSGGQLTARVPPEAAGFVIDTPDAKIVDLGTEFCVAVKKGEWTEVEIVSGHVDVSSKAGEAEKAWSRRLATGDAVRIGSSVAGGQIEVEDITFGKRDYTWKIGPH